MARVRKRITLKKAAQSFLLYGVAVGGALSQIDIPEGDLTDKALITLGVSTLAAVLRAVNNVRKTRKAPARPAQYVDYRNLTVALIVPLSLSLAGCVTTTAPDGTVTQSVDHVALETAWARYERLERQQAELERESRAADAAERARLEAELRRLAPDLADAARRLGL